MKGSIRRRKERRSYICPHCERRLKNFSPISPKCHRPFLRDYVDMVTYIRDPGKEGEPNYATSIVPLEMIITIPVLIIIIILMLFIIFRG